MSNKNHTYASNYKINTVSLPNKSQNYHIFDSTKPTRLECDSLTLADNAGNKTVLSKQTVDDIKLLLELLASNHAAEDNVLGQIKKEMDTLRSLKKMGYQHDV